MSGSALPVRVRNFPGIAYLKFTRTRHAEGDVRRDGASELDSQMLDVVLLRQGDI